VPDSVRRQTIEGINTMNQMSYETLGDPNTRVRIQQYEMAFRMQASVPELTDPFFGARAYLQALR
jgi:hypothetical protein